MDPRSPYESTTEEPPPPPEAPASPGRTPPQPPGPAELPRKRRSPGATAGIVLIVVGALFLLGQIDAAFAWWRMWPLVFVIAGMIQAVTPGKDGWSVARLFDGLTTIAWGVFLLAITTGVVTWAVFGTLLTLWPVLLIALGFELLGKAMNATWVRALGSLAVIAALAYTIAISASGLESPSLVSRGGGETVSASEPVSGIEEANLRLEAGAAEVDLDAGTSLVSAEMSSDWSEPELAVDRSGTSADVRIGSGESDRIVWWPGGRGSRIDARLSDEVLWDLDVSLGVSDFTADLSELSVRALTLKPGIADCEVRLGEVPGELEEAEAVVQAGISSVSIEVPDGAEVRVESETGLTGHDIGGRLEPAGSGVWETPGYDQAAEDGDGVWLIRIQSGIGSVRIDSY